MDSEYVVFSGAAHPALAADVARELGAGAALAITRRTPDGELLVHAPPSVHGRIAVVVQPTQHPGGEHLLELLLVTDACRRAGARRIFAIVPYMGYARQERRTEPGAALGMRVAAEVLATGRFDRIVTYDLHSAAIEGFFGQPVEQLAAFGDLAEAVRPWSDGSVVVAPDLGAAKLAREYAHQLGLPMAVVHKTRTSPTDVEVDTVIGDVRGKRPILVDDMISTAGTIAAAASALRAQGAAGKAIVVATHALLVDPAVSRLAALDLDRLVVTDTLPARELPFPCVVVSVASRIAATIRRAS